MINGFKIAGFVILLIAGSLFRVYITNTSFYNISFFSNEGSLNMSMPKPMSSQGVVEKHPKSTENLNKNPREHVSLETTLSSTSTLPTLLKMFSLSSFSSSSSSSFKAEHKNGRPLLQPKNDKLTSYISSSHFGASEVLKGGNGIIFVETTDRLQPSSLVLCALESAARVYKDRPVVFFMRGLEENNTAEVAMRYFPVLTSFKNLYFFPLRMQEVFADTPLISWYLKVDPTKEKHWIHVSSDGCRLALIWKYGGIYMDSDVISIRQIPHDNFLAAQGNRDSSNGIFGFSHHYQYIWRCMEEFVRGYRGSVWGHQGPQLLNRVLRQFCNVSSFTGEEDNICGNITFLHYVRFFPIPYFAWGRYFQVWNTDPSLDKCYGVHLWNYMIKGRKTMEAGSNTLAEHLYQKYCPAIYADLSVNKTTT